MVIVHLRSLRETCFKLLQHSCLFRSCKHPLSKCWRVFCESNSTTRPFHNVIVVLMGLVDWDCRESVCGLEHNPVSMLFKFFFDRRRQIFHVPCVYRDPASIVVVIHAEEPRHQGFHWVHIQVEVGLPMSTDEEQAQELKVQDSVPKLKRWASADHVLSPGLFCIFSVRFTSWQECIFLKLGQGHSTDLMCSSCSCEMAAAEKGVCGSRGSNTCLGECSSPTWIWQVVSNGLPHCHLYMESSKHDDILVFSMSLWPFPLDVLCQGIKWSIHGQDGNLPGVQELCGLSIDIHAVLDHRSCGSLLIKKWQELCQSCLFVI